MQVRIKVQPAAECPLGNSRTRSTQQLCLPGESPSESVIVTVQRSSGSLLGECVETNILGAVVTLDGENHPFKLVGESCTDGIFQQKVRLMSGVDSIPVCLEKVMVTACQPDKWQEAMALKKKTLQTFNQNLADPQQKLSAKTVKQFRISFYIPEFQLEATTRVIRGVSSSVVASGAASQAAAASSLSIVDILPAHRCCNGRDPICLAVQLRDPIKDNSSISATCSIDVLDLNQPINCNAKKLVGQLIEVSMEIPCFVTEKLNSQNARHLSCRFTVTMETAGQRQSAASKQVELRWGCDCCSAPTVANHYQVQNAQEPRRKIPGSGSGMVFDTQKNIDALLSASPARFQKAASQYSIPQQAVPFQQVSQQAVPFQQVSQQAVPFQSISQQAVPFQQVSQQAVLFQQVSQQAVPFQSISQQVQLPFQPASQQVQLPFQPALQQVQLPFQSTQTVAAPQVFLLSSPPPPYQQEQYLSSVGLSADEHQVRLVQETQASPAEGMVSICVDHSAQSDSEAPTTSDKDARRIRNLDELMEIISRDTA